MLQSSPDLNNSVMNKQNCGVLLVDDNESTNFFNKVAIARCGSNININIATNGKDALELILQLEQNKKIPNVIFLDINMPYLNGIEFLEAYKTTISVITPKIVLTLGSELSVDHLNKLDQLQIPYDTCGKMLNESIITRYLSNCFTSL